MFSLAVNYFLVLVDCLRVETALIPICRLLLW